MSDQLFSTDFSSGSYGYDSVGLVNPPGYNNTPTTYNSFGGNSGPVDLFSSVSGNGGELDNPYAFPSRDLGFLYSPSAQVSADSGLGQIAQQKQAQEKALPAGPFDPIGDSARGIATGFSEFAPNIGSALGAALPAIILGTDVDRINAPASPSSGGGGFNLAALVGSVKNSPLALGGLVFGGIIVIVAVLRSILR